MAKLIQINDYFIDPNRVISVTQPSGPGIPQVLIHVDMNDWTASYYVAIEEDGWNLDAVVDAINEGRSHAAPPGV